MEIIKSFRKTLSLKIDETWKLIVKAPLFASKKTIDSFIQKNKSWIDYKKIEVLEKIKEFRQWEKFYFFWDEYELVFDNKNEKIFFDGMKFYLNKSHSKNVQEKLIEFYKIEARKYIKKRVIEITEKNKLNYNALKITSAKTRWGSCTSKKNINFTYRLIMAPIKVIDYVIFHELAHLVHLNHSKNFRDFVDEISKKMYPWDYKVHKNWLKENWGKFMY